PVFLFNAFAHVSELSLDDAINLALEYNLSLRKTEIDITSSGYHESNLWSEIFPTINASASAGYRGALFGDSPTGSSGFNYSVGFGINFGLNAGIPYALRSIKLAHQGNILRYEDARNLLSIQITKNFFSLIAEKNNLVLLEEIFNLAQRQFTRSETLFRNGLVGELSLTQSRLTLENARFNQSAGRIAYENNLMEFLAMLGIGIMPETPASTFNLIGEINIVRINVDAEELITNYLPSRPDIIRNKQEIERLTITHMQTVRQTRAPSLSLSVDYNTSSFNPYSDTFSATARLNIPIDPWIPGTAREQSISRASGAIEKARLDLMMTENTAKAQIRSLSSLLRNSWDSILIARLSMESAQRSYQLTERGFLNGTVEALVLQDARNNLTIARQRLLQSELSYFNMILDLSAAVNISWKNLIENYGVTSE
ncbi:MAG: TolC family protein, partial [Treponema sp.]|nr:TolC family protein [Treponema sp.]